MNRRLPSATSSERPFLARRPATSHAAESLQPTARCQRQFSLNSTHLGLPNCMSLIPKDEKRP
jgi:hypothetical protein